MKQRLHDPKWMAQLYSKLAATSAGVLWGLLVVIIWLPHRDGLLVLLAQAYCLAAHYTFRYLCEKQRRIIAVDEERQWWADLRAKDMLRALWRERA